MGKSPVSLDIYFLQKNNNKTRDIQLLRKNSETLKIFKNKKQGEQIIYNEEKFFLKYHQQQVFSLIFRKTPLLNYCYRFIRERIDEYFYDTINWYEELKKNFKLGKRLEPDQTIQGLVIKNIYDPINNINKITIKTREGEVDVLIDGKEQGMIRIGQSIKIKGKFDSEEKNIKHARILTKIN